MRRAHLRARHREHRRRRLQRRQEDGQPRRRHHGRRHIRRVVDEAGARTHPLLGRVRDLDGAEEAPQVVRRHRSRPPDHRPLAAQVEHRAFDAEAGATALEHRQVLGGGEVLDHMLRRRRRDVSRAVRARRAHGPSHGVEQRPRHGMHRRAHRDRGHARHRLVGNLGRARQDQGERPRPERRGEPAAATVPPAHQPTRVHRVHHVRDERVVARPPLQRVDLSKRRRIEGARAEPVHRLRRKSRDAAAPNALRCEPDARVVARDQPRHARLTSPGCRCPTPAAPRGSSAGPCPSPSTAARSRRCSRRATASPAPARWRAPAAAGTSAPGTPA